MPAPRARLVAAFAVVYVVWGSTYLAIHYAIQTIPPFLMAGARYVTAGAILYLWVRLRGTSAPSRHHWRNTAVLGVLMLTGGNGGVVWAEQTVPTGIAALLVATVPLWLVVLDWARPGGSRPAWGVLLGVTVGLAGMVELVGLGALHGTGTVSLAGAAALVGASLSWAAGSLLSKSIDLPAQLLTSGMEMIAGGIVLLLAGVVTGEGAQLHPGAISASSLLGLAYLVVFGSLLAFTAYNWLLQHASPAAVGTYAYVNPVVAVFLGWLMAGEAVTGRTLIGAAIILAAVAIITTARGHAERRE